MSKKSRSEAARVASAIKSNKSAYYISDVDLDDDAEDVLVASNNIRKTLGKCQSGFMIISAGVKTLTVVVDLLDSPTLSASEWLSLSLQGISDCYPQEGNNNLFAKVALDLDTPFKLKDIVRANAFAVLRNRQLLEEESEEEEVYFF